MADGKKNFVIVEVSTGYDNAATSIVLSTGEGAKLPDPSTANFNLVWWNSTDYSNPALDPAVEIVRVTGLSTDTLTVVRPAVGNSYNGETSANTAQNHNTGGKTYKMILAPTYKTFADLETDIAGKAPSNPLATDSLWDAKGDVVTGSGADTAVKTSVGANGKLLAADSAASGGVAWKDAPAVANLLKNGNFINNSTNGYGGIADNWSSTDANAVQGGFPSMTKAELMSLLGIDDGDIEGLWLLNEASGNATDLSSNNYTLTDTNTVTSTDDGLMGKARTFLTANSEYLTGDAANCKITGDQTWVIYVKPTSLAAFQRIMGFLDSPPTKSVGLGINTTGTVTAYCAGLSTTSFSSDVAVEVNKWNEIIFIRDNSASTMSLIVNGVKKTLSSITGNMDFAADNSLSIGRMGDWLDYAAMSAQCAIILSVALTDAQVKRLWAATTYKGTKVRRSGTDAILTQDLSEDLVERLRGKTVTLRAKVYATSTNHQIFIWDDQGAVTTVSPSSANTWEEISVTRAIYSEATFIRAAISAATTDGTMWVKEVALYESPVALPYTHSPDDWDRFPRLLRMDIPAFYHGKPYQYEEKRWYTYVPTSSATGSMTWASATFNAAKFMFSGKTCWHMIDGVATTAGTASYGLQCTPAIYLVHNYGTLGGCGNQQAGAYGMGTIGYGTDNKIYSYLSNAGNWGIGVNREFYGQLCGVIL